jgi:hypothetical protein
MNDAPAAAYLCDKGRGVRVAWLRHHAVIILRGSASISRRRSLGHRVSSAFGYSPGQLALRVHLWQRCSCGRRVGGKAATSIGSMRCK